MEVKTIDDAIEFLKINFIPESGCTLLEGFDCNLNCPFGVDNICGACNLKIILIQLQNAKVEKETLLKHFESETNALMSDISYFKAINAVYTAKYDLLETENAELRSRLEAAKDQPSAYETEYFELRSNIHSFPAERVGFGMTDKAVIIHHLSDEVYKHILVHGQILVMIDVEKSERVRNCSA